MPTIFFKRQLLVEAFMEIRKKREIRGKKVMNFVKSEILSSKIDLINSSLGFLREIGGNWGILGLPREIKGHWEIGGNQGNWGKLRKIRGN